MAAYPFHYDLPRVAPKGASEVAIQASCRLRVERQFDAVFIAIPNGGKRGWAGQRQIKAEGVKKGAPDAVIIGGKRNAGKVAFAEFKSGSQLRSEQYIMLDDLRLAGHDVGVFRSQDTLAEWLAGKGWQ